MFKQGGSDYLKPYRVVYMSGLSTLRIIDTHGDIRKMWRKKYSVYNAKVYAAILHME